MVSLRTAAIAFAQGRKRGRRNDFLRPGRCQNNRAVGAGAGRRIQGFDLVLRQWLLVRPDSAEE